GPDAARGRRWAAAGGAEVGRQQERSRSPMRLLATTLPFITLFSVYPPIATAQKAGGPRAVTVEGSVEVTNLRAVQDVNGVGGAAPACAIKPVELVGFTSARYNGNLGGTLGSTRKCQADFPKAACAPSKKSRRPSTSLLRSPTSRGWSPPASPVGATRSWT